MKEWGTGLRPIILIRALLCTALAVTAVGTAACDASRSEIQTRTLQPAAHMETHEPAKGSNVTQPTLPEIVNIDLYQNGENFHGLMLKDDASKQTVMDAVHDCMLKSAAWPGIDVTALEDKITICIKYNDGDTEHSVYHVFDKDGKHCMQHGNNGMYSIISDAVYEPLHHLAMGYHLPYAMTITSGDNSIHAAGLTIWSKRKKDGLCADMKRRTPQEMADHIQYLEIERGDSLTPFTPFVQDRKVYGSYTVYNQQYEEMPFIQPSGLEPQTYLFRNAAPGKYIVMLETSFETEKETFGSQYFFGVIVQERYGTNVAAQAVHPSGGTHEQDRAVICPQASSILSPELERAIFSQKPVDSN